MLGEHTTIISVKPSAINLIHLSPCKVKLIYSIYYTHKNAPVKYFSFTDAIGKNSFLILYKFLDKFCRGVYNDYDEKKQKGGTQN